MSNKINKVTFVDEKNAPIATTNWICSAHVGLVNDGTHGLVLVLRAEKLDDLGDVAHAKQLVRVEELALAFVREVRCKNAIGCTLSALVLACSTGLGGAVAISWC